MGSIKLTKPDVRADVLASLKGSMIGLGFEDAFRENKKPSTFTSPPGWARILGAMKDLLARNSNARAYISFTVTPDVDPKIVGDTNNEKMLDCVIHIGDKVIWPDIPSEFKKRRIRGKKSKKNSKTKAKKKSAAG